MKPDAWEHGVASSAQLKCIPSVHEVVQEFHSWQELADWKLFGLVSASLRDAKAYLSTALARGYDFYTVRMVTVIEVHHGFF